MAEPKLKNNKLLLSIQLNDGLTPINLSRLLKAIDQLYYLGIGVTITEGYLPRNFSHPENKNKSRITPDYIDRHQLFSLQNILSDILIGNPLTLYTLNTIRPMIRSEYEFKLKRINYNSPGGVDLLGLGKVVVAIKDFVIAYKESKRKDKLADKEIEKINLDLAHRTLELDQKKQAVELDQLLAADKLNSAKQKLLHQSQFRELKILQQKQKILIQRHELLLKKQELNKKNEDKRLTREFLNIQEEGIEVTDDVQTCITDAMTDIIDLSENSSIGEVSIRNSEDTKSD